MSTQPSPNQMKLSTASRTSARVSTVTSASWAGGAQPEAVAGAVTRMLRLEENLSEFHRMCRERPGFGHIAEEGPLDEPDAERRCLSCYSDSDTHRLR